MRGSANLAGMAHMIDRRRAIQLLLCAIVCPQIKAAETMQAMKVVREKTPDPEKVTRSDTTSDIISTTGDSHLITIQKDLVFSFYGVETLTFELGGKTVKLTLAELAEAFEPNPNVLHGPPPNFKDNNSGR